jgi:FdrA protein
MRRVLVEKSTYLDSISLMGISRNVSAAPGVTAAVISMATDTNLALLKESGFDLAGLGTVAANDLVIAIDARDAASLEAAVAAVRKEITGGTRPAAARSGVAGGVASASSLDAALRDHPEINLVLISVPGKFAAREADKALRAGRHAMIFSDNVSIEDEKSLKTLAGERGLLVMGPDCGTAVISGVGLGFANQLPHGPVGIVAASGTGAQEVSSILARMGIGVTHIIGTGGRDVTEAIGGAATRAGLEALIADGATRVVVIISKLPSPGVSEDILGVASAGGKPCVVYFAGYSGEKRRSNLVFAKTLTEAALDTAAALGVAPEGLGKGEWGTAGLLSAASSKLPTSRKYVRGLYSGGTLAQEAIFVFGGRLGPLSTNMKLPGTTMLEDPRTSKGHTIVDLGDDAFTRGRAHPMIDQAYRLTRLAREIADPETAVVLLDVVLGYGCNQDPGGEIARALQATSVGSRPAIVASICGTPGDPQDYQRQKQQLAAAGVLVAETNAIAAEWVTELAGGR